MKTKIKGHEIEIKKVELSEDVWPPDVGVTITVDGAERSKDTAKGLQWD